MSEKTPSREPPAGLKQVDVFEITSGGFASIPDELLQPSPAPAPAADSRDAPRPEKEPAP